MANNSILSTLGTGLADGLSQLAKNTMRDINRQKIVDKYTQAGYSPEAAEILVHRESQDPKGINDLLGLLAPSSDPSGESYDNQSEYGPDMVGAQGSSGRRSSVAQQIGAAGKSKEIANRFKETKEISSQILSDKRSSRSELQDLGRLEELNQEGKLDTPGYVEFLKRSGFDIPALMNPESEEFQKIQQGFLKGASKYFGGRISNYEVEQFLKTIPSLSQSPEGRQRVIAGLKKVARAKSEYFDAYEEVLRKNKGVPPYDLEYQVEKAAERRLDKIAEEFRRDLSKPVPKGQNKLITALQAGAGDVVGNIGKIGKFGAKVGLGALSGSKFGVPGAAAGALVGTLV